MKNTKWLGAVLWLSVSLAHADNVIPYGTPTIDGVHNQAEWPKNSHIRMARFYGSDQFADFWLQWDENNLYIAGKLEDYTLFEDRGGSGSLWETWQDDSIEIYLHPSAKLPTNQNTMLDENSRILAFTINGASQRLDRGKWTTSEGNTTALEIQGNTNAKIGNQFLNVPVKWDWACPHVHPTQAQPAQAIVKFASTTNGTINNASDRDQNWVFEVALPWGLVGSKISNKIVGANCLLGTGVIPTKLTPTDGMSLRMNFFRVTDDDGGSVETKSGPATTDLLGNKAPSGALTDEWFVYQGDRNHPKEWANFILSDQRITNQGPQFSNPTLSAYPIDGRRARLQLIAPHRTAAGGGRANHYEIRTQLGAVTVDETIWAGMQSFENAYQPAAPDTSQQLDVIGLKPKETYTIAVRAFDEAGRAGSQILSTTVTLQDDNSKFVTVSPTGRSLVFTDGTPFVVVGETALMPWLPLRGLYNADLCDEHYPEFLKDRATPCSNGSIEGRLRNYYTEKFFYRCYLKEGKPIDIADAGRIAGPEDNCNGVANEKGTTVTKIEALEGPQMAEDYFVKLQAAGVNVLTVFVESLDLDVSPIFFETSQGQYNPAVLEFIDRLVALANKYDVYLILRLYDTYYYKGDHYKTNGRKWSDTYSAKELGKTSPEQFFDEDLYPYHQNRMRVLLERYRYERHILGFDLLNEADNKQRFNHAGYEQRKKWLETMLKFARSIDNYHMMFYSFLAWDPKDSEHYRKTMEEEKYLGMDAELAYRVSGANMAVLHGYYAHVADPGRTPPTPDYAGPLELARGVAYGFYQIRDNRPILDGESGPSPLFIKQYNDNYTKEQGKDSFLNSMWLHFVSGGAGANLRWPIDLDSSSTTINHFSADWRFLLKVFKDTVGDIAWRGNHLKISRRDIINGIIAATRTDGRSAVTYFYNPQSAGINEITLPEVTYGWAKVKVVNPITGEVLLSQNMLVGGTDNIIKIPAMVNSHMVITVSRIPGHLFADRTKATWSKTTDTHVNIHVNAFPFAQEDIYFWLEDSNKKRQYITDFVPTLTTKRLPILRNLDFSSTFWGESNSPVLQIPMNILQVGKYKIGVEVGPVVSYEEFEVKY